MMKMMKKQLFFVFSCIVVLLFSCKEETYLPLCEIQNSKDVYEYPIKPGSNEWKQLSSPKEKISVCQIPESILSSISTKGLIESVLNNPLFGEIYLGVHPQSGFNAFHENFNGVRVLMLRKDLVEELLDRYSQMNPSCNKNNWPSLNGAGSNNNFAFSFIEILIAQHAVLEQIIDNQETRNFLREVINKYEDKIRNNYSVIGLEYSMLICGRIMYLSNYVPFIEEYNNNEHVNYFINDAFVRDMNTLNIIYDYVNKFLEKNK